MQKLNINMTNGHPYLDFTHRSSHQFPCRRCCPPSFATSRKRLLGPIRRHPLEALFVRLVNLGHRDAKLLHLRHQLTCIQRTTTPTRLDDPALLLEREVLPHKARPDVLLEERQDVVVADGARVGKVVDPRLAVGRKQDGARQQVVQDGVEGFNRADARVGRDFGDKRAGVKVV